MNQANTQISRQDQNQDCHNFAVFIGFISLITQFSNYSSFANKF